VPRALDTLVQPQAHLPKCGLLFCPVAASVCGRHRRAWHVRHAQRPHRDLACTSSDSDTIEESNFLTCRRKYRAMYYPALRHVLPPILGAGCCCCCRCRCCCCCAPCRWAALSLLSSALSCCASAAKLGRSPLQSCEERQRPTRGASCGSSSRLVSAWMSSAPPDR
jgi:hypothetical protein